MKIKSIDLRVPTYGPMFGQVGLYFDIEESDEPIAEVKKSSDLQLYKDLKNVIKEKDLEKEYKDSLSNTQKYFWYWKGSAIEKIENAHEFDTLLDAMSHEALELQKGIIGLNDKGELKDPKALRPPFSIFIGVPKVFSASRDFYQRFNWVIPVIDLRDGFEESFSEIALREMINHPNGMLVYFMDDATQFEKTEYLGLRKTSILNMSKKAENFVKECVKRGFRYFENTSCWYIIDTK
jgi:hypothetical protein